MSTDDTTRNTGRKVHTPLSVLTILIGAALMFYMILVESEPGGLPLVLMVLGVGWYLVTRVRSRSRRT